MFHRQNDGCFPFRESAGSKLQGSSVLRGGRDVVRDILEGFQRAKLLYQCEVWYMRGIKMKTVWGRQKTCIQTGEGVDKCGW